MEEKERKGKIIFYTTLQIIGLLIIMLVGNAFDWLHMRFDFSKLNTWNYWNGVIQQIIMYATALIIGYLGRLEKEILNNIEYSNSLKEYRGLLKFKGDNSFVNFIDNIKNPQIKKAFIKKRTQLRLYRLDKRAKDYFKLDYDKAIQSNNIETFIYKDEKSKKYCLKRFQLEQLFSDNYINANFRSISIKYPHINSQAFTYGVRIKEREENNYKVENKTAQDLTNKWLIKALQIILVAVIAGSIGSDANGGELVETVTDWLRIFLKYIVRCVLILISYIMGLWDGKNTFESNYLDVLSNRITILKEYLDWVHQNNINDSIAERIDKYLKENAEKKTKEEIEQKKINKEVRKDTEVQIDKNGVIELTEDEIKEVLDKRKNKSL